MEIRFTGCMVQEANRTILEPFNLVLTEKRIGIVGLNGSGKTTFAKLINGLRKPSIGDVTVNGLSTVNDSKAVLREAGFIFQNPVQQLIMPIVKEDIAYGVRAHGASKAEAEARADEILETLGIAQLARRRVHELSGGENQLVAIASVLATRPSILILDEPVNQLDLKNRRIVANTIAALDENLIVISHDLDLLENFDRVLVFDKGHIAADGPPKQTIQKYREMVEC